MDRIEQVALIVAGAYQKGIRGEPISCPGLAQQIDALYNQPVSEDLREQIAQYLTKQFIVTDTTTVPLDECYNEADHILGLVAEAKKIEHQPISERLLLTDEEIANITLWTPQGAKSGMFFDVPLLRQLLIAQLAKVGAYYKRRQKIG